MAWSMGCARKSSSASTTAFVFRAVLKQWILREPAESPGRLSQVSYHSVTAHANSAIFILNAQSHELPLVLITFINNALNWVEWEVGVHFQGSMPKCCTLHLYVSEKTSAYILH